MYLSVERGKGTAGLVGAAFLIYLFTEIHWYLEFIHLPTKYQLGAYCREA